MDAQIRYDLLPHNTYGEMLGVEAQIGREISVDILLSTKRRQRAIGRLQSITDTGVVLFITDEKSTAFGKQVTLPFVSPKIVIQAIADAQGNTVYNHSFQVDDFLEDRLNGRELDDVRFKVMRLAAGKFGNAMAPETLHQ